MIDSLQIDFVTETFAPEVNGVAMTLGRLVNGLQEAGCSINVFRPRQSGSDQARSNGTFAEHLLPGMRLPMYRELHFGFPASRLFGTRWQQQRPDALYVATEGPLGWSAIRMAERLGIPTLSGFHTNFHTYSRHYHMSALEPLILAYLRKLHRRTACTLVPTRTLADQLRDNGFGHVEVLQRGVDTHLFSPRRRDPELRHAWGADERDLVCLYVGRIAAEKNILEALSAYRSIQQECANTHFVLVGDGPLHEKLSRENPDFNFCGMRLGEDLARHYASADVFLFPSRSETFGNVVTEAMASGLAVVAYNEAAAHEHIKDWQTGVLAGQSTETDFPGRAVKLCQERLAVREIGNNAAQYTQSLDWSGIVQRFAELVREHISRQAQ